MRDGSPFFLLFERRPSSLRNVLEKEELGHTPRYDGHSHTNRHGISKGNRHDEDDFLMRHTPRNAECRCLTNGGVAVDVKGARLESVTDACKLSVGPCAAVPAGRSSVSFWCSN
ncbi:unnamed protein product [Caenorhabditis auriculariae]|uniref:Uncharacterized protein n=1 Tax=Caenorhabditis auriculariae TaxID=2777116 RepID=A0A8S1HM61_9PELO|nr:unnamed protein product [Caenorhabditis auriculariae]